MRRCPVFGFRPLISPSQDMAFPYLDSTYSHTPVRVEGLIARFSRGAIVLVVGWLRPNHNLNQLPKSSALVTTRTYHSNSQSPIQGFQWWEQEEALG